MRPVDFCCLLNTTPKNTTKRNGTLLWTLTINCQCPEKSLACRRATLPLGTTPWRGTARRSQFFLWTRGSPMLLEIGEVSENTLSPHNKSLLQFCARPLAFATPPSIMSTLSADSGRHGIQTMITQVKTSWARRDLKRVSGLNVVHVFPPKSVDPHTGMISG